MSDPYCYPGSPVLKNIPDIRDAEELERVERRLVLSRAMDGVPRGDFDLAHLKAIHRHLFQDVYDWAGKIRTLEISKGDSQFQFHRYIETGMTDVHERIIQRYYLKDLTPEDFARAAGEIMGDINYVHPFREGNGRTQALYLEQLAENAGHKVNLKSLDKESWITASKAAHNADYRPMSLCIYDALE